MDLYESKNLKETFNDLGVTLFRFPDKDDDKSWSEVILSAWEDTSDMFMILGSGGHYFSGVDTIGFSQSISLNPLNGFVVSKKEISAVLEDERFGIPQFKQTEVT